VSVPVFVTRVRPLAPNEETCYSGIEITFTDPNTHTHSLLSLALILLPSTSAKRLREFAVRRKAAGVEECVFVCVCVCLCVFV